MKKVKRKIFVFGNPLLKEDRLPLQLAQDLQKQFPQFSFEIKDPNENLWPVNKELTIIDTAIGIKQVRVLKDISKIQPSCSPCSLHDFDLALNIKLLEKIGELKKIMIFAVPQNISKKTTLDQLIKSIQKHLCRKTRSS